MRLLYILSAYFLLLFSTNCHAQLTNGTKTLDGYGTINGYLSKYKTLKSPTSTQFSRTISLGFTPTYAVFKNNFLLGASVGNGLSAFKYKIENANFSQGNVYINYNFNINPFVRYYLQNKSTYAYFAFADVAYFGTLSNRKLAIGNTSVYAYNEDYFSWRVGFGGHKVLNKNFVAEGTLFYENSKNVGFSTSLRHFYTSFDKKNQDAPPQYIAKNRWQVAASFSANNNFKDKSNSVSLNLLAAKMLNNHFMVGSSISLYVSGFTHNVYTGFGFSGFARYYAPLSNRLFIYPYMGANLALSSNDFVVLNFNRGIGFQYFLTKNLALTCTSNGNFNHRNNGDILRTTADGVLDFGFSYFVK